MDGELAKKADSVQLLVVGHDTGCLWNDSYWAHSWWGRALV